MRCPVPDRGPVEPIGSSRSGLLPGPEREEPVWLGVLTADLLLGDVHSLKEKRSVVRPVLAELRRRFEVSVAEAGYLDLHRRTLIAVSAVSAGRSHCAERLDACAALIEDRPDVEVLDLRTDIVTVHDLEAGTFGMTAETEREGGPGHG